MPLFRSLELRFGAGDGPSDTDLLTRFVRDRDHGAFELLVWRHTGLVFRACWAVLGDRHAAEDAFQATFLALARNAAVVGRRGTVAGWLYQVARRVAARARRRSTRQRAAVPVPPDDLAQVPAPAPSSAADSETIRLLHEEIARLPPRYREPLLLCYLEGLTQTEAARQLGWPIGTVATRVNRAKENLGRRLVRRGVTVPAVGAVGLFAGDAVARHPVPSPFIRNTAEVAVRYVKGQSGPNVSDTVLKLACEVNPMNAIKLAQGIGLLAVGVVIAAIGATAADGEQSGSGTDARYVRSANKPAPVKEAPAKVGWLTFLGDGRIASIRPDGTDRTWHTPEWTRGHKPMALYGPRFDPAGKRVVYGVEDDQESSVYVRTLGEDASGVDMEIKGKSWCWSPDGQQIAVSAVETPVMGEPTTRTWIVDVGTKKSTEVKLPSGHLVTDWSRDGNWFLTASPSYIVNVNDRQVTVMKTDGTAAQRLSLPKQAAHSGRFSPDGKMVVFDTFDYRTRESRLYTASIAGGEARPSGPAIRGSVMGACWSPDGKRIASVWRRNYVNPEKDQKAEYVLRLTDPAGGDEVVIRKETGKMPADEREEFMMHWVTMSGLDWR